MATQIVDTRLVISAIGPGAWGNNILIRIDAASQRQNNPEWFRLALLYYRTLPDMANFVDPLDPANATDPNRVEPDVVEIFDNLVHTVGASNNVEAMVNSGSRLVRTWFNNNGPAPIPVPAAPAFAQLDDNAADGDPITADTFTGNLNPIDASSPRSTELLGQGRGLAAIEAIDEVALLAIPDEVRFTQR